MVQVPLTNNQAAALTSFAFNEGTAALRNSHLMLELNAGNTQTAADCFGQWVYAGGKYVQGLANRRDQERALFLKPDAHASPPPADTADQLDDLYNPPGV